MDKEEIQKVIEEAMNEILYEYSIEALKKKYYLDLVSSKSTIKFMEKRVEAIQLLLEKLNQLGG